ncbi:VOC family protein [Corynebacterium breve]|uniref:VOC family protein n=1 Tax=Corynebacterium breve TaxID=3049799 RepID=A0ABY8VH47_9CORY|nr:VOC family protein [Corynebacterium breve]WIM66860.1 VOC family protein [Corynebacterium breve]
MQKIIPNIWCAGTADEAAELYVDAFPRTSVVDTVTYPTEGLLEFQQALAGQTLTNELQLDGFHLILVNAGNEFRPTPALNFLLNFEQDGDALRHAWEVLSAEGLVMMDLGTYAHSELYGWVEDKFGVSWQLMVTNPEGDDRPFVNPQLMFCGAVQNKCEEATDFYLDVFSDAQPGNRVRYSDMGHIPDNNAEIVYSDFQLEGQWFTAMDSAVDQAFTFNEGVSLMVHVADQAELDRLWDALSADPNAEQCGWLKDIFGVSWQIVPANLAELMAKPGAYEKLMGMKKIHIDQF